ncbi:ATP-grasp domain-containing protein [Vallitalea okinawensis]|uniref:ATP-grasp domain-containing protein n=1 Tax=Vallitalea okinawensis TaxID=2078660 RepID=UPI000CFDA28B|nr:ATP-grasp domain-containing protein [Vallitalea okinawensis]
MKLMILGASKAQCNAISRGKEMGYRVLATDYYEDSPGKAIADEVGLASTFDVDATLALAKTRDISGIMTTGTDQPVYVVNRIAEALDLPRFLDEQTGYNVTNKKAMKKILKDHDIPIVPYTLLTKEFKDAQLVGIEPPFVLKPLDSQGQRGIYKLHTADEIRQFIDQTLSYSREEEALLESYYDSEEVTITGWVKDGDTKIITITDRVTFEDQLHIGICSSHEFPSKYMEDYGEEIIRISHAIVEAFHIENGPIYFQMLIGNKGVLVNEIACRIGGAYEDEFIPLITGIDILGMVIDYSMGQEVDYTALKSYDIHENKSFLSSQLFFANEGTIEGKTSREEMLNCQGLHNMNYNVDVGQTLQPRINATQRAGYMIITGKDEEDLIDNINKAYDTMVIKDKKGNNLVIRGRRGKIK